MRHYSFVSLVVGLVATTVLVVPACSGSHSDSETPDSGGSAGTGGSSAGTQGSNGGSNTSTGGSNISTGGAVDGTGGGSMDDMPVDCGGVTCEPLEFQGMTAAEACCATGDVCGLDATALEQYGPMFDETCQARDQPGELDASCPDSPDTMIPNTPFTLQFKGCCRSGTNMCGYMLYNIVTVEIGLGCVDSAPFLDGETPPACGSGAGGSGAGGSGGGFGAAGGGADGGGYGGAAGGS